MMERIIVEASSYAPRIDHLIDLIFVVVGLWFAAAQYIFISFIVRYARKRHPKAAYISGESPEESKWIHRAHYSVILCDIFIIYFAVTAWHHVKQALPPAESTIRIVGQQWAWKFTDPGPDNQLDTADDISTIDELHVKVNTVYHFKLESKDVLHSFSVPAFRLKQDAIPGRVITGWFKATKTGEYDIQCSQMCGIGHGIMAARLIVETPEQHAAWLEQNTQTNVKSVAENGAHSDGKNLVTKK